MAFSFDLFTEALLFGVLLGCFYAAVSIGLSVSFGLLDVPNVAHPAIMVLGSYCTYVVASHGLDPIIAGLVLMPVFFVLGILIYRFYYESFEKRGSEAGVRNNLSVALQYFSIWLTGNGAVVIFNLMEDAATAEISRAQLWQWLKNSARLDDGRVFDRAMYQRVRDEELAKLSGTDKRAVELLDRLVEGDFLEFLTLPAYALLP